MRGSQVEEVGVGALNGERLQKIDCSKIAGETEMKQMHREESIVDRDGRIIRTRTNQDNPVRVESVLQLYKIRIQI